MDELVKYGEIEEGQTTAVSWRPATAMTFESWAAVGRTMQQLGRSLNWWLGDWLNAGEAAYGEMYAQALDITGMPMETLSKYKAVAARIPPEMRHEGLSWTNHFAVAYADPRVRGGMLAIAAHYEMHSRDLKEVMKLETNQLLTLIHTFDRAVEAGTPLSYREFSQTLNQLRLDAPSGGMVNGTVTVIDDEDMGIEEEGYHEEGTFEAQTHVEDDDDMDDSRVRHTPDTHLPSKLAQTVYLEEVFDFFEEQGTPVTHCLPSEVGWQGMILRATLDARGKPVLIWEKTNAKGQTL